MFSLRTLLLAVVVVAIGVVGLTTRNIWWASVISLLTWMSIAAAIVMAALVSRGNLRWFSIGYAVCAGLYLFVIFSQPLQTFAGTLVTNRVVVATWQSIDVPQPRPQTGTGFVASVGNDIENVALMPYLADDTEESRDYFNQLRSFYVVAHCLWAWLFGSLGALLAGYLARQRDSHTSGQTSA
jgi:hypothetical protein